MSLSSDTASAVSAEVPATGHPIPPQPWMPVLPRAEIERELKKLQPEIAWTHLFKLDEDFWTIQPGTPRYFQKSLGLRVMGEQMLKAVPFITRKADVRQLRVLDLASAEGGHSVEFAAAGAKEVLGIEGRDLYVQRSTFMARCFGLNNVRFEKGDVRKVDPAQVGKFDLVLFYGILHHLAAEDFLPMLRLLQQLTGDTMILFTHTAGKGADVKFGERLSDTVQIEGGRFSGRLYREHPDGMTQEQKDKRVRSSLDNNTSFWPSEPSLVKALREVGFNHISRQMEPTPYGNPSEEFRVYYVCRVAQP
ncbi:MAG TPA: class I SAM-dependent methyltransferase [Ramlibacter sp.]|nr:class I SAM-dependent methyltransferase [Ramlibacter sp.]